MPKIVTIVGARPQFIKIGPVSRSLATCTNLQEIVVHTGQHFDSNMSDVFFRELQLPEPDVNLGIGSGSHAEQTAKMLVGIESILKMESPDLVLVYGDTNSTLAGALAASKLAIPIAHVEAGLRSFNRAMPEEINRIVTDQLSTLLFTPSLVADQNLLREGTNHDSIFRVGDVMYDAVIDNIGRVPNSKNSMLEKLSIRDKDYVLLTLHRAENTDDDFRLQLLADEILKVSLSHKIVFPIHPRTRKSLDRIGSLGKLSKNVQIIDPLGYLDMLCLLEQADLLLTDSGGMQKEAMFLKTPCITLRSETEWIETIESNMNCLFDPESGSLVDLVSLQTKRQHNFDIYPYGKGDAAPRISRHLANFLTN